MRSLGYKNRVRFSYTSFAFQEATLRGLWRALFMQNNGTKKERGRRG